MNKYEKNIGKNIREVRLAKGLSQEALAEKCEFSNTTLSAYENSKKIPSLSTIAKIAKQLKVSIERLYYGDENKSFIISEPDDCKKIVNSLCLLWNLGVIKYYKKCKTDELMVSEHDVSAISTDNSYLKIMKFNSALERLINSLDEFKKNKDTYSDSEKYLEMLKDSVAAEINKSYRR